MTRTTPNNRLTHTQQLAHTIPRTAHGRQERSAKTKPRVAIITPQYGATSQVWLERQTEGLTRCEPIIFCGEDRRQVHPNAPSPPVHHWPFTREHERPLAARWLHRLRHAPSGNFFAPTRAEKHALTQALTELQPDVILCHFGHTALKVLPIAERLRCPMVVHFHGLDLSSSLTNRWYRMSLKRALPRFEQHIVVGSHQRRWIMQHGIASHRVHLLPAGVPTAQFKPKPRGDHQGTRFVAVSRLVPWKGLDFTLRAMARVCVVDPQAHLQIIGDGPERQALQRLAQSLQIESAVTFAGALKPDQVQHAVQEADVFVQHSLSHSSGWCEGFGVSIAEAAASGLPVIVTDCGGIADQVVHGQTGFLIPQRDITAMAEAMQRLAKDPALRQRLGQAGRTRMRQHYDTTQQIQRLEHILIQASAPATSRARE
jgi:glycosyltransferase involved in cell wall biosynthesis